MTVETWMEALRDRIAVKGVTLADLGRATKTERNNLRRLLTNTAAAPRLGSVMRLLPALDSWVEPPGARTAAEVASFLDSERARRGASWEALLAGTEVAGATFARWLREAPERLPLDVVLLVALRLDVEPRIVETRAAETTSHRPESRTPRRPDRPRRLRRSETSPESAPASTAEPQSQPPPPTESSGSPWRLCPPRLGRYRDAPLPSPKQRAQVSSYVPRAPSYALERAVLDRLAGATYDTWRALYRGLYQRLGGAVDIPLEAMDELARGTVQWFERRRRPAVAPRIKVLAEDVDPMPFLVAWRAALDNPDARTTAQYHDPFGRLHAVHGAVGGRHSVDIRLAQGERPHHLVRVIEVTPFEAQVIAEVEVPLVLKVGDEVRSFTHVRAGPVFGSYWTERRGYLLGAVSSVIALVEVDPDGARGIWAGFAEELASTTLAVDPDPLADVGVERGDVVTAGGTTDSVTAELAEARRQLADERTRRADDQRQAQEDATARELARQELQRQLAEVHELRAADQHRAREDAGARERERQELQRQLADESARRADDRRQAQEDATAWELARQELQWQLAEVQELRAADQHRAREDAGTWERERQELQRQLAEVRELRAEDQRLAQEAQRWECERQELQRQLADEKSARAENEEAFKQSATQVVAAMLTMKAEIERLQRDLHEAKQGAPPEASEIGEAPPVWGGETAALAGSLKVSEISDANTPPTSAKPRMAKKLSKKWRR